MSYKVINQFKDTKDNNTLYKKGDTYPKGDYKPTKKRIEELMKEHPRYERAFIEEIVETQENDTEKPSSK